MMIMAAAVAREKFLNGSSQAIHGFDTLHNPSYISLLSQTESYQCCSS